MQKDSLTGRVRANTADDFWARVRVFGPQDCWPWVGGRCDKDGYGRMKFAGCYVRTHRLAYELTYGSEGLATMMVLHRCHNPPCCNPGHLYLGTHADNMRDLRATGKKLGIDVIPPEHRHRGEHHWTRSKPERLARGRRQWRARLTDEDIPVIRQLLEQGTGQREIARRFGVNSSSINMIAQGKAWCHVPLIPEDV